MKKLEDFNSEKVAIDSIYGGNVPANTFSQNTVTIGGGGGADDGSDEDWDN